MSRVLAASEICFRSLRMIGAFPITESAPDGEQLRESMFWLDLVLGEVVGSTRLFSRVDNTLSFTITNGTQTYDLYTALGSQVPADRIQFVTGAWLQDSTGRRGELILVTRDQFEGVAEPAKQGAPYWLHIDRLEEAPRLRIYPTPPATDTETYTVYLTAQRFAPNVAPGGVSGTQPSGSVLHKFGQAWQRFLIFQLAHDIGCGAVATLPEQRLKRLLAVAELAKSRLEAFENREHETEPPICDPAWSYV